MVNKTLKKEVESAIDSIENLFATEDDYTKGANNIVKLHKCYQDEVASDLAEKKLRFEKDKYKEDINQKKLDRRLEGVKLNTERQKIANQHNERMAELEVLQAKEENERLKLENENLMLKKQIEDNERNYKSAKRRDICMTIGKIVGITAIAAINLWAYFDGIKFERIENGILPQKVKGYSSNLLKSQELIMK